MRYPNLVFLSFTSCVIDDISSGIRFPKYLQMLEIPLNKNKQLFSIILNHECLTHLRIFPLHSLDFFEEFKDFNISNPHNRSKINRLEFYLAYPIYDSNLPVKVYENIEKAFGKRIERIRSSCNIFKFDLSRS
ncbi:hypothetical protein DFJ63DRAFT_311258 [Scheffersomyces coipomensis]|uniref:uncharacterized protein n=1 Tax=Scheffersomyces coipomensis TaxID=1788519 RepID=UPI00315D0B22